MLNQNSCFEERLSIRKIILGTRVDYFKQILEKCSNSRIEVDLYRLEQLVKEIETITTGSSLTNWFVMITFCELPYLMEDSTNINSYINGRVGKLMETKMIEKLVKRAYHFCWSVFGFDNLSS